MILSHIEPSSFEGTEEYVPTGTDTMNMQTSEDTNTNTTFITNSSASFNFFIVEP